MSPYGQSIQQPFPLQRANSLSNAGLPELGQCAFGHDQFWLKRVNFGNRHYQSRETTSFHQHLEAQIEIVLSGHFTFKTSQHEYSLGPGQAVLIWPGIQHQWHCRNSGLMIGWEAIAVSISAELDSKAGNWLATERLISFPDPATSLMQTLINEICQSKYPSRQAASRLASSWFILALREALGLQETEEQLSPQGHNVRLEALKRFISANLERPLSLSEIARETGISKRSINRLFRESKQVTPQVYIEQRKLARAKEMLVAQPETPIKAVAFELGYSSVSYFCRRFRQHSGATPSEFRSEPK